MGYRFNDNPPKPEDHLHRFAVRNGATAKIAFGCYYLMGHDSKMHDHVGWPSPDNPDHVCQIQSNFRLYGLKEKTVNLQEIHLIEEGYTETSIEFDDQENAQYLDASTWIDEDDDNIVRVKIDTDFPMFEDKPIDMRFTVFVRNDEADVTDAVCHGMLTILPGSPYQE